MTRKKILGVTVSTVLILVAAACQTQTALTSPVVTEPSPGAELSSAQPTLKWQPVAGALSYEIALADDPAFETITYSAIVAATQQSSTMNLEHGQRYYFRVRAVLANDRTDWTTTTFTVSAAVEDPTLDAPSQASLIPAHGKTDFDVYSASFAWDRVAGATSYEFLLAEETDRSDPFGNVDVSITTASNEHTVMQQLKFSSTYNWAVRALGTGGESAWTTGSFTTKGDPAFNSGPLPPEAPTTVVAPPPVIIEPAPSATGASPQALLRPIQGAVNVDINPTFTWGLVAGATSYEFVLAEEIGLTDMFAIINYTASTTTNAHVARETLEYSTVYHWRVRAIGATTGAWTTALFITEAEPPPP